MSTAPYSNATLRELERLARNNVTNAELLEQILDELSGRYNYDARLLRQRVERWFTAAEKAGRPVRQPNGEDEISTVGEADPTPANARNEFGIADERDLGLVRVLERIRERLLDLSNRNQLLNYRHPKTRALRIVDEVPSQVFSSILSNTPMTFEPLNMPDGADLSPLAAELPGPEDGATPTQHKHAREDDERIAIARRLGVDPSYDLPFAISSEERTHNDQRLQTLLRPHELEKLLRVLHRHSVAAIQESGANMLHLMFGFVEWRDVIVSGEETPVRLAPLVLLPVSLERSGLDPRTRAYRYSVTPTGEDWSTNVTLHVKCRREFGFELPMIGEDDENLEAYFERVEALLRDRRGWRLRRFLTLGLVSFGKILMWRDLDATTWPTQKPLLGNSLLRDILGEPRGESAGPGDPIVAEYAIDGLPPDEGLHLPLIADADSSQHSVVVDVRRGRNLVVQGPPGTGKSQTITNIIGDALSRGKKVLFVAEKKAALDVVAKRLNEAGIGPFCLALHSHTSQKREFLEDLILRLDLRGKTRAPRDMSTVKDLGAELCAEISGYCDALHQPFGAVQFSPFHILWRARRLTDQLGPETLMHLKEVRIEECTSHSLADVLRRRAALEQFAAAFDRVNRESGSTFLHPWAGVGNDALTFQDVEALVAMASDWLAALEGVLNTAREAGRLTGVGVAGCLGELSDWVNRIDSVKAPAANVPPMLPLSIVGSADLPLVRDAIEAVEHARSAWKTVDGRWAQRTCLTGDAEQRFRRGLLRAKAQFGATLTPVAAAAFSFSADRVLASLERLTRWADRLEETIGISLPRTTQVLGRYAAALQSFDDIDDLALDLRSEPMRGSGARRSAEALAARAAELRSEAERMDALFDRALRPDAASLKAHVTALTTAPRFLPALWSGPYRRAIAAYRSMTAGKRAKREAMTAGLRRLVAHSLAVAAFEGDEALHTLFGQHARGLDTPFSAGLQLLSWWESVRELHAGLGGSGSILQEALWRCPAGIWGDVIATCRQDGESLRAAAEIEHMAEDLRQRLSVVGDSWNRRLIAHIEADLREARELLAEVVAAGESSGLMSLDIGALLERLDRVVFAWKADEQLAQFNQFFRAVGVTFQGMETETGSLVAALEYLSMLKAASLPLDLEQWLVGPDPADRANALKRVAAQLDDALRFEEAKRVTFFTRGRVHAREWLESDELSTATLQSTPVDALYRRVGRAKQAPQSLHSWAAYQRERAETKRLSVDAISDRIGAGQVAPHLAADFYETAFYRSLVAAVFREQPSLQALSGDKLSVSRRRFAEQDEKWIALARRDILHRLNQAPTQPGIGYGPVAQLTDEALIRHEAGKIRRHIAIRQLFRRAGNAVLELKPCFLMGPQAVAQYLTPGMFEFDIVIMDEASQMRPEDALGAIARGKQLVVVGDPKQLGPTRFFDRIADDEEELEDAAEILQWERCEAEATVSETSMPTGGSVLERSESILRAAAARYPTRLLRWHYRSKHPKLIAFSNREFYNENLIIFPAPGGTERTDGVVFRQVPGGVYEPRARRNVPEARLVVKALQEHAREYSDRSLLVATLNSSQAEIIDALLQEAEKDDPVLAAFRRRFEGTLEPLVIKNLENVQGDERDVVFVSVTFGRNPDGRLHQFFGPINQLGGERRLNVLFTRAKYRLEVFCSFDPSDLRVDDDASAGLQTFQAYLMYAQEAEGAYGRPTGRGPDSDFEIAVANSLSARGYDVRCQVGVAGYFLDIGVIHPDHPGRFILGVECDGAMYHSSRSARDRDRLREMVLREEFHWNLHRIWSTDWFRDPVAETNRVVAAIEARLASERAALGRGVTMPRVQ